MNFYKRKIKKKIKKKKSDQKKKKKDQIELKSLRNRFKSRLIKNPNLKEKINNLKRLRLFTDL